MKRLVEIARDKEKALLITVILSSASERDILQRKLEFEELVISSGCKIIDSIIVKRALISPRLYIGEGKAQEIASIVSSENLDVVIFNNDLSPVQQRNLEIVTGCKIIDRTQLILDIFAQHAHSPEGKLQVELAQLQYLASRLKGKGLMLSRLGGGIGTRGPGEKKLEVDRRRIEERIIRLKKDISGVRKRREILRLQRKRRNIPVVSLIGYTNAGKSTLLNALTNAGQEVQDSLFTTLDPLSRTLTLPNNLKLILTDTVGFIEDLPQPLIEAFMATLEEIGQADLLLEVIDMSFSQWRRRHREVLNILKKLNFQVDRRIVCFNKIDILENRNLLEEVRISMDEPYVFISAKTGENMNQLLDTMEKFFEDRTKFSRIFLPHHCLHYMEEIYTQTRVVSQKYTEKGLVLEVEAPLSFLQHIENIKDIEIK